MNSVSLSPSFLIYKGHVISMRKANGLVPPMKLGWDWPLTRYTLVSVTIPPRRDPVGSGVDAFKHTSAVLWPPVADGLQDWRWYTEMLPVLWGLRALSVDLWSRHDSGVKGWLWGQRNHWELQASLKHHCRCCVKKALRVPPSALFWWFLVWVSVLTWGLWAGKGDDIAGCWPHASYPMFS